MTAWEIGHASPGSLPMCWPGLVTNFESFESTETLSSGLPPMWPKHKIPPVTTTSKPQGIEVDLTETEHWG